MTLEGYLTAPEAAHRLHVSPEAAVLIWENFHEGPCTNLFPGLLPQDLVNDAPGQPAELAPTATLMLHGAPVLQLEVSLFLAVGVALAMSPGRGQGILGPAQQGITLHAVHLVRIRGVRVAGQLTQLRAANRCLVVNSEVPGHGWPRIYLFHKRPIV